LITFDEVSKTFPGGVRAVQNLSMEISGGETLVLLGTSGCGKTTTLKIINRLIEPTSGRVLIKGTDIMDQDPIQLRRGIGYAIQDIGLFPHMAVGDNIAVVPRLLNWSKDKIAERVDQLLSMVGLEPDDFRDRFPVQLSGGQRQRVGVARALAADPPIVLMDEPFGALDPITREQLQNELIELQSEIRKTIIFVTHDVFEAVKVGDRIALLDAGQLQQLAAPTELVDTPANEFVDQFLGQHRFQLSLLTKTIKSFISEMPSPGREGPAKPPDLRLSSRSSLIEALDMFKKTNLSILPVYEGKRFLGNLQKKELLQVITHVLGETGVSQ
jgi:osmoprotectant transport system ATP-binding protein